MRDFTKRQWHFSLTAFAMQARIRVLRIQLKITGIIKLNAQ